jgi:hypothetical protein
MRAALIGVLIGAMVAAGCSGSRAPTPPGPNLAAHLSITPTFHTDHVSSTAQQVQSIVQVDANEYLMCDYFDVFRLARDAAGGFTVTTLTRPPASVWSPAGLYYRDGLLYIADNLGHDVLVVRESGNDLVLVRRVARQNGPAMKTPRNLVAETDGSVVVTDYGGDSLLRFNGDGSLAWSVPMPGAGGVAESGGFIYATSTSNHTVIKLNPTGKVVAVNGAYGWSPGRFVFPIGLASAGGQIIVTDAVTGRVTLLDQNLHSRERVGGNGPGDDALDYPYATLPTASGYMIADTYKARLVITNRAFTIQEQIVFGRAVPAGRQRPLVYGTDARPTSYTMIPGVDVLAQLGLRPPLAFTGGFDGLDYRSSKAFLHLNFDDARVPIRYVTWAQQLESVIVIGSPQSPWLEVIDRTTGMFTYVFVQLDTWWRAGFVVYPQNLRLDLAQVVASAINTIAAAKQLIASGASRESAFDRAVVGHTYDWSQNVSSPEGRQFLASGRTRADASVYYAWAVQQPSLRVAELLMVKYLSGS